MKQITVFYLDDCLLGMDSVYINSILPPASVMTVPQREEQLFLGLIKLPDSRLVHIINSERILGLSPSAGQDNLKVVTLQHEKLLMGLLVDGAPRLMEIAEDKIMRPDPMARINLEYLSGTVEDSDGELIMLLDMPAIFEKLTEPGNS